MNTFGAGADGRLFVTRTGRRGRPVAQPFVRPVSSGTTTRVLRLARADVFTAAQQDSPLARRPYDLRHACVSTWLAAGVAPSQVAAWAGHSVAVLLRVYAHALDGQEEAARRRIAEALGAAQPPLNHSSTTKSRRRLVSVGHGRTQGKRPPTRIGAGQRPFGLVVAGRGFEPR